MPGTFSTCFKFVGFLNKSHFSNTFRLHRYYKYSSYARINSLLASDKYDQSATVKGWVKTIRKLKSNIFVDINDGSCSKPLQIVITKEKFNKSITYGSSIVVSGELSTNPQNQLELVAREIHAVGECDIEAYPFRPKKSYSNDYIRQYLHFRFRTKSFSSVMRVRHKATMALHDFFEKEGYLNIHTPILTSNDCEGAGEVFSVMPECKTTLASMKSDKLSDEETFFGSKAYLTVSGQLHLETAARGIGNVYTFGPTFRAENSKSRLHLAEFYMAEAEIPFTNSVEDVTSVTEKMIKHMTEFILNSCPDDVHICREMFKESDEPCNGLLENLINNKFTIMTYREASSVLYKNSLNLTNPHKENQSFTKEHELFLVKYNDYRPLFVIDWPRTLKPFYMKQHPNDSNIVIAFDLLCDTVGELCGGSLREDDYSKLKSCLSQNSLQDKLSWYLELRKYGNICTGGFGMGFERYLQVLLNITNIKDVIPFPRWPHNCKM